MVMHYSYGAVSAALKYPTDIQVFMYCKIKTTKFNITVAVSRLTAGSGHEVPKSQTEVNKLHTILRLLLLSLLLLLCWTNSANFKASTILTHD
jgi:hypothetical protein